MPGHDENWIEHKLDECSVCGLVPRDAVTHVCAQLFCADCWQVWQVKGKGCPQCRQEGVAVPSYRDRRDVMNLMLRCPHSPCKQVIRLGDKQEHVEGECSYRTVVCQGCREEMMFITLSQHSHECKRRKVLCELCTESVAWEDMDGHLVTHGSYVPSLLRENRQLRELLKQHQPLPVSSLVSSSQMLTPVKEEEWKPNEAEWEEYVKTYLSMPQRFSTIGRVTLAGRFAVTDVDLFHLRGLVALQTLNLSLCSNITNRGLIHLSEMTQLRDLNLSWCSKITGEGLLLLSGLAGLQALDLAWCGNITKGLVHLRGLTVLRYLNLFGTNISDRGLVPLAELAGLRNLNLRHCYNITDRGLVHLRGLTTLQTLNLSQCKNITDGGLVHLRGLTGLQNLNLW